MVATLKKFDVFISFCGEDTRRNFTSHLYEALSKKVLTFIDDAELERGDEITSALIKAIEESDASIIIFSRRYASSKWCLNELLKILECKKDQGQIVIPVFYEIEPSHVRNQTGSYNEAFEKLEQNLRHNKVKLQKWKDALTEAANLSGWDSQNYRTESNFIKDIVVDVLKKLNCRHPFEVNKELVGIEKKYEKTESLLKIGSNDVRTLGLWGMGGIGKSTLAKHLYAKLYPQFERHCFFENVREESTRYGLNVVRHKIFSALSELCPEALYVETPIFKKRLARERSLIVLDDVATLEQAENLNIINNCLGEGSRVIITTRDKQICSQFDECEIYEVEGLSKEESLQLFCRKAFGAKLPKHGYEYLSKMAVLYCRGNPLDLKVLGTNFRTKKSIQVWKSELEKVKKIPNGRIHDVLKSSFDDLDSTQQDIFLDIACISNTETTIYHRDKYYLAAVWNACNFFAESGLEVLQYKALIYFKRDAREIEMHGLLEEMGKEIVKNESPKDPGRRSRLWDHKEVYDVLKYCKGTEVVEVIEFDISKIGDLYLSSDSFKNMTNLRYLHITTGGHASRLHLLEGLDWLSDKLRHLYWKSFPLESLPSTFCAEWLVQLDMQHSKLKKLWDGIQRLDNLIVLILDYSKDLIEIPDLSRALNLQLASFSYCESLYQLHPSIFSTPKLIGLHLIGCKKIERLKTNIYSKSFKILNLTGCSSLVECWVTSEKMMELKLHGCRKLKSLPKLPSTLKRLTATNCTYLNTNSIQGPTLENMLHRAHSTINYGDGSKVIDDYAFFPGTQVPSEFCFRTTEASIVIPPIPKSGLCGFVFCIILSEEVVIGWRMTSCIIYEHTTKAVDKYNVCCGSGAFIADHVWLGCIGYYNSNLVKGNEKEGDHYNLSFEFKCQRKEKVQSAKGIKGCGIIPIYDLKHSFVLDGRISCRAKIVELQSNAQLSSDSDQHSKFHNDELQSNAQLFNDSDQFLKFDIDELQSSAQHSYDSDQFLEFDTDELQSNAQLSDDSDQFLEFDNDELQSSAHLSDDTDQFLEFDSDELQSSAQLSDDSDQYLEFDTDESQSNAQLSDDTDQFLEFDIDELQSSAQHSDDSDQYSKIDIDDLQPSAQLYDDSDQYLESDIDELQSSAQLYDDSDQYSESDIDELQSSAQLYEDSDQYSDFDIDELHFSTQISDDSDQYSDFDIDKLLHRSIGADVRFSKDENEDDQQQLLIALTEKMEELNDKSSCSCSIGILMKHMLEKSKRLFLLFLKQQ